MDSSKQTIANIEALLKKVQTLRLDEEREQTIFSIGSRGYYENPTSDLLQFFLNDAAAHGLNNLVLKALVACLPDEYKKLDCSLVLPPEREVHTENSKRLDLLLESTDWVMVIENKIFHQQNNPFTDYEGHIEKYFPNKRQIYVVLSPAGTVPPEYAKWLGVSYPALINALKMNLSDWFINHPLNKWAVLLREFLLHLEHLMAKPCLSEENLNFVLGNLKQIKEAQDFKVETITRYQESLKSALSEALNTELKGSIVHWYGYPALRFAMQEWISGSDVVLFLDGRDGYSFAIHYYCENLESNEQRLLADAHLEEADCAAPWDELKGRWRCYRSILHDASLPAIQQQLLHKIRLMDAFERKIRPTLRQA